MWNLKKMELIKRIDWGQGGQELGKGDQSVQNKLVIIRLINSGHLMYSIVTIVNKTVLYS